VVPAPSFEAAIRFAKEAAVAVGVDEVMVVGGGEIYAAALPLADRLYITHVDALLEGDVRFPSIDQSACMGAIHLVLADGRVLAGADALPEILRRLRRWRWLAGLLRIPGARRLAPRLYQWVVRHRYRLSCSIGATRR